MFGFRRKRPGRVSTRPRQRIYAIGDVHGRRDLLVVLLDRILANCQAAASQFADFRLVFLGDLIDRGPESRECLEIVRKLADDTPTTILRGNHEDLMLNSARGDGKAQQTWFDHGGLATLASFGIAARQSSEDSFDFAHRLRAGLPDWVLPMLKDTCTHMRSGDYFFAHAGVRPGVRLRKQDPFDLFFIRDEFTRSPDWHGAVVVHGHSIVGDVEIHPNRIAVDTGAYFSDRLSCVVLQGQMLEVLTT